MKVVITSNISKVSARYKRIAKAMPQAVEHGLEVLADEAIALHYKTTRTWKREKPKFYWKRTAHGIRILTDSQIYQWVDAGTKPHIIRAVNAPMLSFRYPYKAATKPRVISSTNSSVGKNWARKFEVHHPGTKARNFTDEIAKRTQKRSANVIRAELEKAINQEAVGM